MSAAAVAHNERWLPWLTREIAALGLKVTPSVGNFILIHFPTEAGRSAKDADAFLTRRGLVLRARRRLRPAELPAHDDRRRGGEPARRRGAEGLPRRRGGPGCLNASDRRGINPCSSAWRSSASASSAPRSRAPRGGSTSPATIVAVDADAAVLARVRALGLADEATSDAARGARGADLVILCVPVGAYEAVAKAIAAALKPGAIVSDVGSVKGAVVAQVQPHLPPGVHFVPAHPVAGTEHSGPDAGFATLFHNRWCILTPPDGTDDAGGREGARASGPRMGSNVEIMTAQHHDLVLAITSHVPHLIAYNIVGTAADLEAVTQVRGDQVLGRRLSRLHPHRRLRPDDVARRVPQQQGRGARDARPLHRGPRARCSGRSAGATATRCYDLFTRTRAIRRGIISVGQETPEPDFGRRREE